MTNDNKKIRIDEINKMIEEFCDQYLNDQFKGYAQALCEKIGRKRTLSINKGGKKIWAAAIIYVIARLNFLFDKKNDYFITADIICDFFGTKKTTSSNKATQIEKACNIRIGEQGLCNPEITDMLTFYETPEGFILPKSMIGSPDIEIQPDIKIQLANGEEVSAVEHFKTELKRFKKQQEQERKERREKINQQIAEKKKKRKKKTTGK
ncbi:MAG: hypothetical protein HF978_02185 [Desulfobacteraceae bacterium]|nr:hypothetical protein [Desulfobacteraceae bacterium]MBC2754333.1 hypothetical protein [Desulfobacteraceae bacterium]